MTRFPYIAALFLALMLFCCTQVERDNPYDPDGVNYNSGGDEPSSDSDGDGDEPSSSSEPGSLAPSSSSLAASSSSLARSSSSLARSSSGGTSSSSGICTITSGYCLYSGPHDCWPMPTGDCCEYGTVVANQAACSTTAVKFCNRGTCVGGDGWGCNGGGGCFTINSKDTEANCRNDGAAVVDCCPDDTRPPSANYQVCSIVSSSSLVLLSSSSVVVIVRSSSSAPSSSSLSFVSCTISAVSEGSVTCGGQTYRTVQIGEQVWFAENLNYNASGSKCYSNSESNCNTYGRLYDWATAKTVCPGGWHLPSIDEWHTLSLYVQSTSCSGCDARFLKNMSGWSNNGNGTNAYGFSALPGGLGLSGGSFSNVGDYGFWWSASEYSSDYTYGRNMFYGSDLVGGRDDYDKSYLFSVRCIQDSK